MTNSKHQKCSVQQNRWENHGVQTCIPILLQRYIYKASVKTLVSIFSSSSGRELRSLSGRKVSYSRDPRAQKNKSRQIASLINSQAATIRSDGEAYASLREQQPLDLRLGRPSPKSPCFGSTSLQAAVGPKNSVHVIHLEAMDCNMSLWTVFRQKPLSFESGFFHYPYSVRHYQMVAKHSAVKILVRARGWCVRCRGFISFET